MNAPVPGYFLCSTTSEAFAELDDVHLLVATRTREGSPVPAGAEGTILSVWANGEAYIVEFEQGLATVKGEHLTAGE